MKKLLNVFIVVIMMVMFGFQSNVLAGNVVNTNNVQLLDIVPPAPTNSYIKVTSYVAVTNGIGGYNYYMYVESYTTNRVRNVWGEVSTNLVTWVAKDTSKIKYDTSYFYKTNNYEYERFLCIGASEKRFFRPILDPH